LRGAIVKRLSETWQPYLDACEAPEQSTYETAPPIW